jgi:NAD(P)-dependent dehydrogenase (short-subunit alcohol dehydrogenase family)
VGTDEQALTYLRYVDALACAVTKSLAANLVDRGIRVNAIAPGPGLDPLNVTA